MLWYEGTYLQHAYLSYKFTGGALLQPCQFFASPFYFLVFTSAACYLSNKNAIEVFANRVWIYLNNVVQ